MVEKPFVDEVIGAQMTFPFASVVRAFEPEQLWSVPRERPPPITESPPAMVEVAVVEVAIKKPARAELPSAEDPSTENLT